MKLSKQDQDLLIIAHTGKYLLTSDLTHTRLEVYNSRLANELNTELKLYPKDYVFQIGEEGLFQLKFNAQVVAAKAILHRWSN